MQENVKHCHIPGEEGKSFFFDYVHIHCNDQISLHQQKTWELSYIISGRGIRVIGDTVEPFKPGEVILIPPNIPHHWSFDESGCDSDGKIENITIVFPPDLLEKVKNVFIEFYDPITRLQQSKDAVSFGGQTLRKLQVILLEMKAVSNIERLSSLLKLLALISTPEIAQTVGHLVVVDEKSQRLQKIHLYVTENYQQGITLEEMAAHVGMEKTAFCIFFKKMTGKSFFSFLTEYRIDVACEILLKTNKTIAEICIYSGFRDIPYFNRVFKRMKNITPGKYREKNIII